MQSPGKLQGKLEELDQKLGDMEKQIAQDEVAQVQLQQSLDVSTMVRLMPCSLSWPAVSCI